jgi:hypothetical protein
MALAATRATFGLHKQEEADLTQRDHKLLTDAAMGTPNQRPQDWNEFLLQPGVRDALSRHGNDIEDHLRRIVLSNPDRDRYIAPNHESITDTWTGNLRYENKAETLAKIASNPSMIRELPVTKQEQDHIWSIYQRERESLQKTEGQLRVDHGYGVLRSAGYLPRGWVVNPGTNKPRIAEFKSKYGVMVEKAMEEKKILTDKDYMELGKAAMRRVEQPGWFWTTTKGPYYETLRPGHEPKGVQTFESYKKEFLARPGHESASDEEIMRTYVRNRLDNDLKNAEGGPKKVKTEKVAP